MQDAADSERQGGTSIGWGSLERTSHRAVGYFDYLPQPAIFDYCRHTVQRFRDWLRAKYRSIEALNAAWYRGFSSGRC